MTHHRLGTPTQPLAGEGEFVRLEVRSSDPANPSPGQDWLRGDLTDAGEGKIGEYRRYHDGGTIEVAIYALTELESGETDALRVQLNGETGFIPLLALNDAQTQAIPFRHDGQTMGFGRVAIPDSEDLHSHWDVASLSLNDNDEITTLPDETDNNHDLTGSATFAADEQNGLPVSRFNGTDEELSVDFSTVSQPNHIFFVARFHSIVNDETKNIVHNTDTNNHHAVGARDDSTTSGDGDWELYSGTNVNDGDVDTDFHVFSALFDGSNSELRIDGSSAVTGDPGSEGLGGHRWGGGSADSVFYDVDIGEVLIYPQDSTSIQGDVEAYLIDKWVDSGNENGGVESFATDGTSSPLYSPHEPPSLYDSTADQTVVTWQGDSLDPQIAAYDHSTGSWGQQHQVSTNPLTEDDHGAPSLCQTSDGHYHVYYGSHNSPQKHARSDSPSDVSSWTVQPDIASDVTYPMPNVMSNDDLYLSLRERDPNASDNRWETIYKSTDGGDTWSNIGPIINFESNNRIYSFKTIVDGDDIHYVWLYSDDTDDIRRNVYHAILDTTDDSLRAQDGTSLSLPLTKSEADANCLVFDSDASSEDVNQIRLDLETGTPHILFTYEDGGSWTYQYAHWDGSSWTSPETITQANNKFSSGAIRADGVNDVTAYLSIGSSNNRAGELEEWHYGGSSWSLQKTLISDSDTQYGVNNPRITNQPLNDEIEFIVAEQNVDDTTTRYSASTLKVWAYGSGGFVG